MRRIELPNSSTSISDVRNALISLTAGVLLSMLILELALHALPVSTGYDFGAVDVREPIMRGSPHFGYTSSRGWNFQLANSGSLNNYGFRASYDYAPIRARSSSSAIRSCRPTRSTHGIPWRSAWLASCTCRRTAWAGTASRFPTTSPRPAGPSPNFSPAGAADSADHRRSGPWLPAASGRALPQVLAGRDVTRAGPAKRALARQALAQSIAPVSLRVRQSADFRELGQGLAAHRRRRAPRASAAAPTPISGTPPLNFCSIRSRRCRPTTRLE